MHIRFAQIEPTTRCNYTCGFCVGRHMPQTDLALQNFQRFIDSAEGLEAIELQGEGEPLLHTDFFSMIDIARAKFPNIEISMITNGSMFTTDNIEKLLAAKVGRIFVSAESVDDENFQKIRGGKLERVRRGIRALLAARNQRQLKHPILGLSITVLRSTAGELHQAIPSFYQQLGLDGGINIQPLQNMPQYSEHYSHDILSQRLDKASSDIANTALQTSVALKKAISDRGKTLATGFYERLYSSVDSRLECPWLANGAYMTTEGTFVACCHVKDYNKYGMGNLEDAGKISENRKALQKTLANGAIPEQCAGCTVARNIVRNNRIVNRNI